MKLEEQLYDLYQLHTFNWMQQDNDKLLARGSVVVKALCCKPEGRGFKSR
jgi:hypothetical protein